MKLRQSHMPDETLWESLFDIPLILDRLGIDATLGNVVELGCGYGTFTLPIAQRISGKLYALDIEPQMVERTRERAIAAGITNVICEQRDVVDTGYGMRNESVDACLLFNILHGEQPLRMLNFSADVVRLGGFILVIHWRHDPATPRGPSMDIRPQPQQIADWSEQTGRLEPVGNVIDLPPWHYGWRFRKMIAG